MTFPVVRSLNPALGYIATTQPAAGVRFSWFDPSLGERTVTLQHGQSIRVFDEMIGERTVKLT